MTHTYLTHFKKQTETEKCIHSKFYVGFEQWSNQIVKYSYALRKKGSVPFIIL